MQRNEIVIHIEDLKKYYGDTRAVDGISFQVEKGEIFGFLGPNGAGKTTTIRCMMDLLRPDSGHITILDRDAGAHAEELKYMIGYLSGEATLYENWTGKDHIELAQKVLGVQNTADRYIDVFKYDPDKKIKELSSGNRQKLALILALLGDPSVLIMDEPTVGLDPLLQNSFYEIVKDLSQKGTTVFMSSHNLAEVERVCGRAAIIREGTLVSVEEVDKLREKHVYTARVIFSGKLDAAALEDENIEIIEKDKNDVRMKVRGDIDSFVKRVSSLDVEDIEIKHVSLEELFLDHYKEEK